MFQRKVAGRLIAGLSLKFLHHAFKHPRKMLHHAFGKEKLEQVGIEATARAQKISLEKWKTLFQRHQLDTQQK